jgi:hypothetical protein
VALYIAHGLYSVDFLAAGAGVWSAVRASLLNLHLDSHDILDIADCVMKRLHETDVDLQ